MESSRTDHPLISVIVVNWNGLRFLDDCLASLERQTWPCREFILVDNGSTDGTAERIRTWTERRSDAQAIYLPENTGFCRANNLAFAKARGEWIALLNNDAVAEPDWLEELVRHGDAVRRVGMLGGKILFFEPAGVIDKAGHLIYWDGQNRGRGTMEADSGQYARAEEILWPDACAAMYHRRLFEETGGFDESFFAYGDDADLGMRARLLGWKAWYVPTAVVHHRHSAHVGRLLGVEGDAGGTQPPAAGHQEFPVVAAASESLLDLPPLCLERLRRTAAERICRQVRGDSWMGPAAAHPGMVLSQRGTAAARGTRKPAPNSANRRLSRREIMDLLRRFQIDVRELTQRD